MNLTVDFRLNYLINDPTVWRRAIRLNFYYLSQRKMIDHFSELFKIKDLSNSMLNMNRGH